MTRYDDRLIDLDLREVLGAESPPDVWPALAPQIGSRGGVLRLLPGRRPALGIPTLAWVAAALLVVSLGLFLWASRRSEPAHTPVVHVPPRVPDPPVVPEPPAPLGRADRPILIAAADGRVREGRDLVAGEHALLESGGVTLRLRDGASVELEEDGRIGLDDVDGLVVVEAEGGHVRCESGTSELVVRTEVGDVRVEANTRFDVELRANHLLARVSRGRILAAGIAADAGEALVWLGDLEPRVGTLPPDTTRAYVDERLATFDTLATALPGTREARDAEKSATQGTRDLERRLTDEPSAWWYAVPWLERRVRDLDEVPAGRLALALLVADPDLRALPAIHLRLRDLGVEAQPGELLPLAERTEDAVAVDLIRRKVRGGTSSADVFLATFLALRGESAGRGLLERALRTPDALTSRPTHAFAAAAALHRLGEEQPWQLLRVQLETLVEEALAAEQPWRARMALASASYFAPVVRAREVVSVDDASRRVQVYGLTLPLETAEDFRRELGRLP